MHGLTLNRLSPKHTHVTRLQRILGLLLAVSISSFGQVSVSANNISAPRAPGSVSARARGSQILVMWMAPATGGSTIKTYYVYANGKVACATVQTACLISGLKVAVRYRITVAAKNRVGVGPQSTQNIWVTPYGKASAPSIRMITLQDGALVVAFTPPASNGGSSVTQYDYSLDGGKKWTPTDQVNSPIRIEGVANGRDALVALRAENQLGAGRPSANYPTTRVAFFGDSLVWGEGATEGPGWNKQVAQAKKWQQINFAVRGTGYNKPNVATTSCSGFKNIPSLLPCAQPYNPNVVVISAGVNDCDYVSAHPIQTKANVEATMSLAKSLFPNARILVTPVISFTTKACWTTLDGWISDAVAANSEDYADSGDTWVLGRSEMQFDGVHPNDLGHTQIANKFTEWFDSLPK